MIFFLLSFPLNSSKLPAISFPLLIIEYQKHFMCLQPVVFCAFSNLYKCFLEWIHFLFISIFSQMYGLYWENEAFLCWIFIVVNSAIEPCSYALTCGTISPGAIVIAMGFYLIYSKKTHSRYFTKNIKEKYVVRTIMKNLFSSLEKFKRYLKNNIL